jgi:ABC-type antimicrobial peptide transport system permease subunit
LGASASRLFSQALAECLVFSSIGGAAGLLFGRWSLRALLPLFAASLPASASVDIDARVTLFAFALTLVVGVAFGCVVALHHPRAL